MRQQQRISPTRARVFRFLVTTDELSRLRAGAQAAGAHSVSDWVRSLSLREAERLADGIQVQLPRTAAAALVEQVDRLAGAAR